MGDEVFVVEGASIPFIFREVTTRGIGNDPSERLFNLVGEGYVLGVMNGEIWDLVDEGKVRREKITIR